MNIRYWYLCKSASLILWYLNGVCAYLNLWLPLSGPFSTLSWDITLNKYICEMCLELVFVWYACFHLQPIYRQNRYTYFAWYLFDICWCVLMLMLTPHWTRLTSLLGRNSLIPPGPSILPSSYPGVSIKLLSPFQRPLCTMVAWYLSDTFDPTLPPVLEYT